MQLIRYTRATMVGWVERKMPHRLPHIVAVCPNRGDGAAVNLNVRHETNRLVWI